MKKVGTYIVRDEATGAFYIGSTGDYVKRRGNHVSQLRCGKHGNPNLQAVVKDPSQLSWEFTPTETREAAYELEGQLLAQHGGDPKLCNVNANPYGSDAGWGAGRSLTDDHRANMSKVRTGKPKTAEWSEKIAEAKRIRIVVDGVTYQSATEAAAAHNTSVTTVMHRVRNTGGNFNGWHFATE